MPYKDPNDPRKKESSKKYYEQNKAKVISLSAAHKRRVAVRWQDYKKTLKCTLCPESHQATLDFHHIERLPTNQKVYLLAKNAGWERIMAEVAKCMVLCANCHRKLHHEERVERKLARKRKKA